MYKIIIVVSRERVIRKSAMLDKVSCLDFVLDTGCVGITIPPFSTHTKTDSLVLI